MRISDWSSDVCSSDLASRAGPWVRRRLTAAAISWRFASHPSRRLLTLATFQCRFRPSAYWPSGVPTSVVHSSPCTTSHSPFVAFSSNAKQAYSAPAGGAVMDRSEEHTSELQVHMRIPYAVIGLK